jgi:hypothetical protein
MCGGDKTLLKYSQYSRARGSNGAVFSASAC